MHFSLSPLPPWSPTCRRTRGDGNCFFRSFFFGLLEHLLLTGDAGERERLLRRLEALKQPMVVAGYDEMGALAAAAGSVRITRRAAAWPGHPALSSLLAAPRPPPPHPTPHPHSCAVLETPLDMVVEMVRGVGAPLDPLTIEGLESNMRDDTIRWGGCVGGGGGRWGATVEGCVCWGVQGGILAAPRLGGCETSRRSPTCAATTQRTVPMLGCRCSPPCRRRRRRAAAATTACGCCAWSPPPTSSAAPTSLRPLCWA